jgi:hypothetical protein
MLAFLSATGCTTCHEVKVSTSSYEEWNADVRHRVCGSYSGYAVAVYRASEGPPGVGEGEKEPFQAVYKTEDNSEGDEVLVRTEWDEKGHLVIHHNTRTSVDNHKSKPMITKAESEYQDVLIEYDPKPVIWENK